MHRTHAAFVRRVMYQQQTFNDLQSGSLSADIKPGMRRTGVVIVQDKPDLTEQEKQRRKAERVIGRLFLKIGIPPHMMGSVILREAVVLCLEKPDRMFRLMHELYPLLAETFGSTVCCIERDVRNLVSAAWEHGQPDAAIRVLGPWAAARRGKPTNGEIIALLTERVRIEMDKGGK